MNILDLNIKESYDPEIYFRAVEIFISDHANFLFGRDHQRNEQDLSEQFHKAKSGSEMLGFTELSRIIDACEKDPFSAKCIRDLEKCLNATLNLIKELSDQEIRQHK